MKGGERFPVSAYSVSRYSSVFSPAVLPERWAHICSTPPKAMAGMHMAGIGAAPQVRPNGSSSTSRCTCCPRRKHRSESCLGKTGVNVCLDILAALTDQCNSRLHRLACGKGHLSLVCELWVEVCNVFRGKRLPCRWICQPVARTIGRACARRGCCSSDEVFRRRK